MSPNALALLDKGVGETHQFIDDTPLKDLVMRFHPTSAVTFKAAGEVVRAGLLRQGLKIANGFNEVKLMSEETKRDALRSSDVELSFEQMRREMAHASRPDLSDGDKCLQIRDHGLANTKEWSG